MKRLLLIFGVMVTVTLLGGTFRNPDFWRTPDQRGEALFRAGKFAEAARAYRDPWHIGMALYRSGDFAAAARAFARVPGADGAFDQGNAWLMHGQYEAAMASYDRALGFRPAWKEAEENKALALARKKRMEDSGKDRDKEQADAEPPDGIKFDEKKNPEKGKPVELADQKLSDDQLRATWLRHVQTKPGDFLRAKFAWQAANPSEDTAKGAVK